jgi:excisionase family DNA binding protein
MAATPDPRPFLTVSEVALRVRLSRATVRRAIRLGQLRALRPHGIRRVVVPTDAVEEFLRPSPRSLRMRDKAPEAGGGT